MTMDLWYDLAIRERPDPARDLVEGAEPRGAEERPAETEAAARVLAVDFF
jgi:hypothetical protein